MKKMGALVLSLVIHNVTAADNERQMISLDNTESENLIKNANSMALYGDVERFKSYLDTLKEKKLFTGELHTQFTETAEYLLRSSSTNKILLSPSYRTRSILCDGLRAVNAFALLGLIMIYALPDTSFGTHTYKDCEPSDGMYYCSTICKAHEDSSLATSIIGFIPAALGTSVYAVKFASRFLCELSLEKRADMSLLAQKQYENAQQILDILKNESSNTQV